MFSIINSILSKTSAALLAGLTLMVLFGCGSPPLPKPTPPPLAKELIYYDWPDNMPQSVLDAFTAEYGVRVKYLTFSSGEEGEKSIRAGQVYDVVNVGNELLPSLITDGLLAEIDQRYVPNFKNVSANFRDLVIDPGNRHSVPLMWGTVGLVVRSDLVQKPVTRWADLWDERYTGQVLVWSVPRTLLAITLKSLGYSINSEQPAELNAALQHLLALKRNADIVDYDPEIGARMLANGEVVMSASWAYDALQAQAENSAVSYILPEEGAILWGDNHVIPINSPHKYTAELFINFILRPEINAQISNQIYYATPNDAARPFIKPEILNNPIIFPPDQAFKNAEIMFPLSPAGQKLYDDIWAQFMAARSARAK